MTNLRKMLIAMTAAAMAAGLGACREDERNRPLTYQKGEYGGVKSSPLNEQQLRALRQRHRNQAAGSL